MTIIEKIQNSVKAATGLVCYYQSVEQLDRIADNAEYPCAYLFLLQQQGLNIDGGNIRERLNISVFFVNPTEFDFNAVENERIIERCRRSAFKWLRYLMRNSDFRLISENGSERVYDEFDVILTGYAVNVTIEELKGVACDE